MANEDGGEQEDVNTEEDNESIDKSYSFHTGSRQRVTSLAMLCANSMVCHSITPASEKMNELVVEQLQEAANSLIKKKHKTMADQLLRCSLNLEKDAMFKNIKYTEARLQYIRAQENIKHLFALWRADPKMLLDFTPNDEQMNLVEKIISEQMMTLEESDNRYVTSKFGDCFPRQLECKFTLQTTYNKILFRYCSYGPINSEKSHSHMFSLKAIGGCKKSKDLFTSNLGCWYQMHPNTICAIKGHLGLSLLPAIMFVAAMLLIGEAATLDLMEYESELINRTDDVVQRIVCVIADLQNGTKCEPLLYYNEDEIKDIRDRSELFDGFDYNSDGSSNEAALNMSPTHVSPPKRSSRKKSKRGSKTKTSNTEISDEAKCLKQADTLLGSIKSLPRALMCEEFGNLMRRLGAFRAFQKMMLVLLCT